MTSARRPAFRRAIISTTDLDRADTFYGTVLGLHRISADGDFQTYDLGEGRQLLLHRRPAEPSDAAISIGLVVSGMADVTLAWQEAGGIIVDPPAAQPWGELMAVVRDPDGHLVCLSEW